VRFLTAKIAQKNSLGTDTISAYVTDMPTDDPHATSLFADAVFCLESRIGRDHKWSIQTPAPIAVPWLPTPPSLLPHRYSDLYGVALRGGKCHRVQSGRLEV